MNTSKAPSTKGTVLDGAQVGSTIRIDGPLYRADLGYGWLYRPLKEEAEEVYGFPGPIRVSAHTELYPSDKAKQLPPVSIKTAIHANAVLKENPVSLMFRIGRIA